MAGGSDENEIPKTTRRKRAVRKRASTKDLPEKSASVSRRRVSRTKASSQKSAEPKAPIKEVKEPAAEVTSTTAKVRKAPTPLKDNAIARRKKIRQRMVVAALLLVGVVASAAVGSTDQGQIDVVQAIEARNERLRNNAPDANDLLTSGVEVPTQSTDSKKPDGGLVGRGIADAPVVEAEEIASTTATSSLAVASSTEMMASTTDPLADGMTVSATTTVDAVDTSSLSTTTDDTTNQ